LKPKSEADSVVLDREAMPLVARHTARMGIAEELPFAFALLVRMAGLVHHIDERCGARGVAWMNRLHRMAEAHLGALRDHAAYQDVVEHRALDLVRRTRSRRMLVTKVERRPVAIHELRAVLVLEP
jgi:hypothetical protein